MKTPTDPARGRGDGNGAPSMLSTLKTEVKHAEQRLALAQQQLRDWLREHPEEHGTSVYETRGPIVIETGPHPFRRW